MDYQIVTILPREVAVLSTDGSSYGYYYVLPKREGTTEFIDINSEVILGPFDIVVTYRVISEAGSIDIVYQQAGAASDPGALTNAQSSTITDNILEDVSSMAGFADAAACERNFSELNAKINSIRQALLVIGILLP